MSEGQLWILIGVVVSACLLSSLISSRIAFSSARRQFKIGRIKSVTAEEICLVSKTGVPRLFVALNSIENILFRLYDQKGELKVMFGLMGDGGEGLALLDKYERVLASLKVDANGQPRLRLSDRQGRSHAVLGLEGGKPVMAFIDANRNVTWRTP
jgi:hypothetical protein